jgi:hypothetical protein
MSIAITLDGVGTGTSVLGVPDVTVKEQLYQGTLTFLGNYTPAGDALSFANIFGLLSQTAPLRVEVYEEPSTTQTATNYRFIYAKGAKISSGLLWIFVNTGAQFSAGAYGTTFSTTTIKFRAWFPLGQ